MKLKFMIVGKAKEKFIKEAYDEYLKRISKYGDVSLTYLNESSLCDNPSQSEIAKALDEEGKRGLNEIKPNDCLVLIDLHGKMYSSEEFASLIKEKMIRGSSSFVFFVGSSYGLSDLLRKRADISICLSKMTTTHPLALLMTLEQVYRAFKINSNETYHK